MTLFSGTGKTTLLAALTLSLLMISTAALSQTLSSKPAGATTVKIVGQLPGGMSVRSKRLSLPSGYTLRRTSKKSAQFSPARGLSAGGGSARGGSGTIECDGCCDLATTGNPPKVYCSHTDKSCGCITTITIK